MEFMKDTHGSSTRLDNNSHLFYQDEWKWQLGMHCNLNVCLNT